MQGVGGELGTSLPNDGNEYTFWNDYPNTNNWKLQLVQNGTTPYNVHVLIGCVPWSNFSAGGAVITPMQFNANPFLSNVNPQGNVVWTSNNLQVAGSNAFCFLAGHEGNLGSASTWSTLNFPVLGSWYLFTQTTATEGEYDNAYCFSAAYPSGPTYTSVTPVVQIATATGNNTCNLNDGQSDICVTTTQDEHYGICAITGLVGNYADPNGSTFIYQDPADGTNVAWLHSEHPGNSTNYDGANVQCVYYVFSNGT